MASAPDTARTQGADTETPAETDAAAGLAVRGAAVSIDGVSVAYGPTAAVADASLEIRSGELVALLGPSGCGKTSLLRAVAGLERPTTGTITIGGRTVSDDRTWVHPEQRSVGMVFQDGALFPHLTVAQNIEFGLRSALGSRRARADRVATMLDLVDLAPFADRLPDTLSGGQQQRVALARSLAPQPSVLLLDEPFSALDAALRIQVRAEVAQIVRDVGVTTIFVTHDQDEAFVLGDRVAVMREGRIQQVGSPDDLYRTPATEWVAGFVGEANFVAGQLAANQTPDAGPTAITPDDGAHCEIAGYADTLLGPVPVAPSDHAPSDGLVRLLVRPEAVALHEGDDAVVAAVEYYGHDVRYELRLDDGSTLAARTKTTQLHSRGDRVCVRYEGPPAQAWPAAVGR